MHVLSDDLAASPIQGYKMPKSHANGSPPIMMQTAEHGTHPEELGPNRKDSWERSVWIFIALSFGLRLLFLGLTELLPEEAYYWQFSRRLDLSYLDHPPAIAWLIYAGTHAFGHQEFGVRIGAYLCSLGSAYFLYRIAEALFDRRRALSAVLLYSLLPYFFLNGLLATPDAPLVLCSSGYIYYLLRALRDHEVGSWTFVGACMGLGMLSKYTMALNGLATLALLILHRPSRRWLLSPYPYWAALVAATIFSPVIYWNYSHDWISFGFQTSRRLQAPSEFSLHILLAHILILLTPVGLYLFAAEARTCYRSLRVKIDLPPLLLLTFSVLPLLVFATFSLRHEPKPNWTGPGFLIALPWIASSVLLSAQRAWRATLILLVALYSLALTYLGVGLPGVPYSAKSQRYVGWQNLGSQIGDIRKNLAELEHDEPLVVGMDKHFVTSELAFYTPDLRDGGPIQTGKVVGRSIFGMDALMWELWDRPPRPDATLILVARGKSDLEKPELSAYVDRLSEISEIATRTRGSISGRYYYRIAHGYHLPIK